MYKDLKNIPLTKKRGWKKNEPQNYWINITDNYNFLNLIVYDDKKPSYSFSNIKDTWYLEGIYISCNCA